MKQAASAALVTGGAVGPAAEDVELAVERALDARWPARGHPRMTAFAHAKSRAGWTDLTLTIELDYGLELPFEMPDATVMTRVHGDLDGFAAYVATASADTLENADQLRQAQEKLQLRCEAFCRRAAADGLSLRPSWISLAPYARRMHPRDVRFDVALEGLGEHLQPAEVRGEAGSDGDLSEAFGHVLDEQRRLVGIATANTAAGADGRVDAVALALITAQADPRRVLLEALLTERLDLSDGSELAWRSGVLVSSGTLACGGKWHGSHVDLPGRWFSRAVSASFAGGPASALTEHAELGALTVTSVVSDIADGRAATYATLEAPVSFFDVRTGRVWPVDTTTS